MHFPILLSSIAVELLKPHANKIGENLALVDEHQEQQK